MIRPNPLAILPQNATYYFTQANIPRALNAEQLQNKAEHFGLKGKHFSTVAEAVAAEKHNLPYYVLLEFVDASARKVKADETHKEQFVQDYIAAAGYASEALNNAKKESAKKNYQMAKDNIDAHFINSGVATCDNLQAIYAPKVEASKSDLEYLKQVVKVMKMLGCTESEAYFAASEYAHAIEPTAETAIGCGYMYYKKGDFDKCISYFDNAIELEQDPIKKADYCYSAAAVCFSNKQLSKAKQYARKSIELNGENAFRFFPNILDKNLFRF